MYTRLDVTDNMVKMDIDLSDGDVWLHVETMDTDDRNEISIVMTPEQLRGLAGIVNAAMAELEKDEVES